MRRQSLDETLKFVAAVDCAPTSEAVADILLASVRSFGFTKVVAGVVPSPQVSAEEQLSNVLMSRWPAAWSRRYSSKGYLTEDPTIQRVRSSIEAFEWSELSAVSIAARNIMEEAADFGLNHGFTVPLHTLDGEYAALSIAGDRCELPASFRGVVQLMATYAFAKAIGQKRAINASPRLTIREADVLHWIAEGKTDWEISQILGVSEHLVDKVARQLKDKFGAVNRVQMISCAMRLGVIR
uniref:Autoinducer-binding domain protein n=1 Tax=Rhodopseudomonas palustris (strain DX-1) TaxID=652103 RepID=E6VQ14_RHOPX